jgi:hypothetical protein
VTGPRLPGDPAERRELLEQVNREWVRRVRRHAWVMWGVAALGLCTGGLGGLAEWPPALAVSGALALTVVGWNTMLERYYPLGTTSLAVRERFALMGVALAGFGLGLASSFV